MKIGKCRINLLNYWTDVYYIQQTPEFVYSLKRRFLIIHCVVKKLILFRLGLALSAYDLENRKYNIIDIVFLNFSITAHW